MPFITALNGCRRFVSDAFVRAWHNRAVGHPLWHPQTAQALVLTFACAGAAGQMLPAQPHDQHASTATAAGPAGERPAAPLRSPPREDEEDFGASTSLPYPGLGQVGAAFIRRNLTGTAALPALVQVTGAAPYPAAADVVRVREVLLPGETPSAPLPFSAPLATPSLGGSAASERTTPQDVPEPASVLLLLPLLLLASKRHHIVAEG